MKRFLRNSILFLILACMVYSYTSSTFTNGLAAENITFANNQNVPRFISIPKYVNITSANLFLKNFIESEGQSVFDTNMDTFSNSKTYTYTMPLNGTVYSAILNYSQVVNGNLNHSRNIGLLANYSNAGDWSDGNEYIFDHSITLLPGPDLALTRDQCLSGTCSAIGKFNKPGNSTNIGIDIEIIYYNGTEVLSFNNSGDINNCNTWSDEQYWIKIEIGSTNPTNLEVSCYDGSVYQTIYSASTVQFSDLYDFVPFFINHNDTLLVGDQPVYSSNKSELNINNRVINITNIVKETTEECSCANCVISEDNCTFLVAFFEDSYGISENISFDVNITAGVSLNVVLGSTNIVNITNSVLENYQVSFDNQLSAYLPSCQITGFNCVVPINLSSSTAGTLEVSKLELNYTYSFELNNCSRGAPTLNFTVKDVDTGLTVNSNITTDFLYSFDSIAKNHSPYYQTRNNFSVCIYPAFSSFGGNYTLFYEAVGYPQRRYTQTVTTYNNQTSAITLYLLGSSEGIYVRFRTTDIYSNVLTNVEISMKRYIGGVLTTVEQESTDDSGIATFWADPDVDYIFTFTKVGYTSVDYALRPTTSEIITIEMGTQTSTSPGYGDGIIYSYGPSSPLSLSTSYNFYVNLSSSIWDITNCSLVVSNYTASLGAATDPFNSTLCYQDVTVNTGTNTRVYLGFIYTLNGTENKLIYVPYKVLPFTDTNFTLVDAVVSVDPDLIGSGFDSFAQMLTALLAITIITALAVGPARLLSDPEPVVIMIVVLVWGFSYFGWFQIDALGLPAVANLPKYYMAYIVSLVGAAFLADRAV